MAASILIILFSLMLLAYWLRYTCLLLLRDAPADREYPLFSFPRARKQLNAGICDPAIEQLLDRDYATFAYLLKGAPVGIEARLLVWDYRLIRCWYIVTRAAFPLQARMALQEMADVVAALASKLAVASAQPISR